MYGIKVGTKVTSVMPDGLLWPATAISNETVHKATTRDGTEIEVTRFDAVSLRETREGVAYHVISNEVGQYGYRPNALPRFTNIIGLDVAEDGTMLTIEDLIDLVAKSASEFQKRNFDARSGVTDAASL